MNLQEFKGKSVVVTGAAAGMGKAISKGFLENGAIVIGVDINKEALESLKEELNDNKDRFIPFVGDISEESTNEEMIQTAVEKTGKIDILVNNAGIAGHSEPITVQQSEKC